MEDYRKIAIKLGQTLISKAPETREDVERMLPELKESEDERIRKNCIHFLELQKQHHAATFEIEECIAWLEKQCENISLPKFTFDDVLALQCAMEAAKKVQKDKDLYEQLKSLHNRLHDAYWLKSKVSKILLILQKLARLSRSLILVMDVLIVRAVLIVRMENLER